MTYQNHAQFLTGEEYEYMASELDAILPNPKKLGMKRHIEKNKSRRFASKAAELTGRVTIALKEHLSVPREKSELRKRFLVEAWKEFRFKLGWLIPYYEWVNFTRRVRRWCRIKAPEPTLSALLPREWLGAALALVATPTLGLPTETKAVNLDPELVATATLGEATPHTPSNWLSGEVNLKGSKAAVAAAFNYATEAGYIFAADETERDRMVADGTLVRLEGKYIRLVDVTEPFVFPVVANFVNRLGEQYAARGCGKLEVTGAMRNNKHQATLGNGSSHSVHPTGMAVDLRRAAPSNETEAFCLNWLEDTLGKIEEQRRIDVTVEKNPRHFHVVAVPHVYEAWLKKLPKSLDPEVKWLATALYFEAAFDEHGDGYTAIASVIKNRVRSREFPNTVLEVVAEGAAGKTAGGCQFSFMCDGRAENIQLLCGQHPNETKLYWQSRCENRWEAMVKAAEYLITTTEDPTGGAVLYYAASMGTAPYWAQSDMKRGTIRTIGSHVFARSNYRGSDVGEKGGL